MDAAVDEKVDALVDGIGYAIMYAGGDKNMDDIVNAAMDTFGDAAVSARVDAIMQAIAG